jgi:tRNA1(Val) A37 N6-methylase TrmN6
MKIERKWSMPNKWTFTIKPISELLKEEVTDGLWCDPFAGKHSPAQITNDLREEMPTTHHTDALEFLKEQPSNHFDGVLFDPPYSITQAKQCYEGVGMELLDTKPTSMKYWGDCKTEVARILKEKGKAICFGWTSMGIGLSRGFTMQRILLVPHGGSKNDTIVTVETKDHIKKQL